MDDVAADLQAEAETARRSCTSLLKMRRDLAEAWVLAPDDEPVEATVERLLGAYLRAAYGLGYVDAIVRHPERVA